MVEEHFHWLKIPEHITYKLCTLVFKAIHGLARHYLSELYKQTNAYRRHLMAADQGLLSVARRNLETYGPQAFHIAGPEACNSLPNQLRDKKITINKFVLELKTYLFHMIWRH